MPRARARTRSTIQPAAAAVYTTAQCRQADRLATEEFGIPSLLLMEHASRSVAEVAIKWARRHAHKRPPSVWVCCGTGNNGGDGLATARHLHNSGWTVQVMLAGPEDRYQGDARTNLRITQRLGVGFIDAKTAARKARPIPTLVIDALLGTGLTQDVRPALAAVIEMINDLRRRGSQVLSIDVPSGLDADAGVIRGSCVRAHRTVTLMGLKPGLRTPAGRAVSGRVSVGEIGMPRALLDRLATEIR